MADLVPTIDLSPWFGSDPGDRSRLVAEVDEACRTIGFFCAVGHRQPAADFAALYALTKAFFRQPLERKRRVAQPAPDQIRGYIAYGAAALGYTMGMRTPPDWKESFSIGPVDVDRADPYFAGSGSRTHFAANLWPDDPPGFQAAWTRGYRNFAALADTILEIFARALGQPANFFRASTDRAISIMGAMYYPDQPTAPLPGQLRAGPHTDFGTITLLRPDGAPGGLQVRAPSGEWAAVQAPEDGFVVNIGDLLSRWSGGRWASTLHRVVNPPPDRRAGTERLSIGFFHKPNYDALIDYLPGCRPTAGALPAVLAGDHIYRQFTSQALEAARP